MGKIPLINLGDRPSAVVGSSGIDTSAGQIAASAGGMLGAGLDRAVREEQRLQDVMKRKQQIVDTISAGRISNDFEEQSYSVQETLKERHVDDPEKAIGDYIAEMNARSDDALKTAPNDAVRQHLATETQNQISAGQKQMHEWISARQTQKAKEDVSTMVNQATRGAENLTSPEDLSAYLDAKEKSLRPFFELSYGVAGAGVELKKMRARSTMAYSIQRSDKSPLPFLQQLKANEGPLVDNLDVDQRDELRKRAKQSFEGLGRTREFEIVTDGAARNDKFVALYNKGAFDAATAFSAKTSLDEQKKSIAVNPAFDEAQKARQTEIVDRQLSLVNALDTARRRGQGYDEVDDDDTVASLMRVQDGLFGKGADGKGEDLAEWQRQQTRLVVALGDGKISRGTFNTMYKQLSLAFPAAAGSEEENTGHWFWFKNARQAGNIALNDIIEKKAPKLDARTRARISLSYMRTFNLAVDGGSTPSKEESVRMALDRFYLETGTPMPTGRPR